MARLRQLHPSNYGFPGNTSNEFENVVRYLNAAEFGNKTLAELLGVLFDADGNFDGPIEMRVDAATGLQFRVGEYTDQEAGWQTLYSYADLRGAAGVSCGIVAQPIYANRIDVTATEGQTIVAAGVNADTAAIVYKNGLLRTEDVDYTVYIAPTNPDGTPSGTSGVIFSTALEEDDSVTIFLVLSDLAATYRRQDYAIASPTSVLAFSFSATESLSVSLNGVLQSEGALADYVLNQPSGTIAFNSTLAIGDRVSVIVLENTARNYVAGLMLAEQFVDSTTGFVRGNRVLFVDESIPPAKITGLEDALYTMASATSSATSPDPETQFWIDTSVSPARLMYWDGTVYLPSSGDLDLPGYSTVDALTYLQVNGTGTALQWGTVDLSGLVRKTDKGAANGVASLDANGRLLASQLPNPRNRRTIWKQFAGTVTAADEHIVQRIFMEKGQIVGVTARLGAGTASIQMSVDGVDVGSVMPLSVAANDSVLGSPVPVDGTLVAATIKFEVTAAAAASDLDIGIVFETTG